MSDGDVISLEWARNVQFNNKIHQAGGAEKVIEAWDTLVDTVNDYLLDECRRLEGEACGFADFYEGHYEEIAAHYNLFIPGPIKRLMERDLDPKEVVERLKAERVTVEAQHSEFPSL